MKKFNGKYRIPSNRAQFWNYSSPSDYFITICVSGKQHVLGNIIDGKIILSEYGEIVKLEIKKIPEYHKRIILETWVIMPNHVHFIVSLGDYDFDNGISTIGDSVAGDGDSDGYGDGYGYGDGDGDGYGDVKKIHEFSLPYNNKNNNNNNNNNKNNNQTQLCQKTVYKPTIDEIKQYRKQRRKMIIPKILGKFQQQTSKQINILRNTPGIKNWQANYHDHIIRNDKSYENIRNYIINNPQKWTDDKFNSKNPSRENS